MLSILLILQYGNAKSGALVRNPVHCFLYSLSNFRRFNAFHRKSFGKVLGADWLRNYFSGTSEGELSRSLQGSLRLCIFSLKKKSYYIRFFYVSVTEDCNFFMKDSSVEKTLLAQLFVYEQGGENTIELFIEWRLQCVTHFL